MLNNVFDLSEGVEIPGQKPNISGHMVADAAGPKRLKNVAYPLLRLFQPNDILKNVLDHSEGVKRSQVKNLIFPVILRLTLLVQNA
jgi:hypothetical protein